MKKLNMHLIKCTEMGQPFERIIKIITIQLLDIKTTIYLTPYMMGNKLIVL